MEAIIPNPSSQSLPSYMSYSPTFKIGHWSLPLDWPQAWLSLCKIGFTSGTAIHIVRLYRQLKQWPTSIDNLLHYALEIVVNLISYKRTVDLTNMFRSSFIEDLKKSLPSSINPLADLEHFVPRWQKFGSDLIGLDFSTLYTAFYELYPSIPLPSWLLNQASLEPYPSIEDVFHQVAWNHPGSFYATSLFFPFLRLHVFSDPTTSVLSFSRTHRPLELERKTIRGILRRTVRSSPSPPSQAILGSSPNVTVEMSQATRS